MLSSFLLYVILKVFSKAESEDSKIKITAKTRLVDLQFFG